jgi:hypothetical protein
MKITQFALHSLLLVWLWTFAGCATSRPDPLVGWKPVFHDNELAKSVVDDYWKYFHSLPPNEASLVNKYSIEEFEDGTGQHAAKLTIPYSGTWLVYVLIYDRDNIRVKTIRYTNGHYRS